MHYWVTPPDNKSTAEVFRKIREMLKEKKQMLADRQNLMNVYCAPLPQ
ncbi:MAG TPA: hypothetical protein VGC97_15845 [Pyrinomonadaceae bacterium]|jgi:hypothetical protein